MRASWIPILACLVIERTSCTSLAYWELPSGELNTNAYSHVVAIPDTHGDAPAMLRSIWLAVKQLQDDSVPMISITEFADVIDNAIYRNLAPNQPVSSRRSVALIQLGDLVDRGPYSVRCMQIMQVIGPVLGWTVLGLYGNHEIMNMLGVADRYIHPRENEALGGQEARKWMMGPEKPLRGIFTNSALAMVRLSSSRIQDRSIPNNPDTLFVHAGVDLLWLLSMTRSSRVNAVNKLVRIHSFDTAKLTQWNRPESLFWTRSLDWLEEEDLCGWLLESALDYFQVSRVIVGHSPQPDKNVTSRCNGRIILADVMMSRWMEVEDLTNDTVDETSMEGGRPVALILTMTEDSQLESIVAHYTDLKTGTVVENAPIFPEPVRVTTDNDLIDVRIEIQGSDESSMREIMGNERTGLVMRTPVAAEPSTIRRCFSWIWAITLERFFG